MVIHWPARIRAKGELRSQFSHVNDIVPTILEAVGIGVNDPARTLAGKPAPAFDGTSLVYSFDDAKAPSRHRSQYFEVFGHRAIYHDGWMASAFRGRAPWRVLDPFPHPIEADRWALYDLEHDFSQARDLATAEPERLRALQALFLAEAERNSVLPLVDDAPGAGLPKLHQDRRHFVYPRGRRRHSRVRCPADPESLLRDPGRDRGPARRRVGGRRDRGRRSWRAGRSTSTAKVGRPTTTTSSTSSA